MTVPRRMFRFGPQQGRRWLISLGLGALLLTALLWEAGSTRRVQGEFIGDLDREEAHDDDDSANAPLLRSTQSLRNPDRWEGHDANQQLRLVRQCVGGSNPLQQCLSKAIDDWRSHPASYSAFLEALRYHERQVGHVGDIGPLLDHLLRVMSDARDQTETYQFWLAIHRHRSDSLMHRFARSVNRLRPRYLGLLLQADQAARLGSRSGSHALYEAASVSFLDAMLEKMRRNESIAIETFNQTQDLKDLARLYLQLGWWPEAERILYSLVEQEPADKGVLSLLEQLRRRQAGAQAG